MSAVKPILRIDRCACGWWKYAQNALCVHCELKESKRAKA